MKCQTLQGEYKLKEGGGVNMSSQSKIYDDDRSC